MWCRSVWEMAELTLGCFSQVPPTATHIVSESLEADVRVSCWWPVTDGNWSPVEVEVKPGKCPSNWGLIMWKCCLLSCSCCVWEQLQFLTWWLLCLEINLFLEKDFPQVCEWEERRVSELRCCSVPFTWNMWLWHWVEWLWCSGCCKWCQTADVEQSVRLVLTYITAAVEPAHWWTAETSSTLLTVWMSQCRLSDLRFSSVVLALIYLIPDTTI